jgi:fructoselysine/glucoselysine PTS system EIIA component
MIVQEDMNNKTRKFLIATHGALAEGFRSSLELIAGAGEAVVILQAYLDESGPVDEALVRFFEEEETEWVVFSDLLGGSITNQLVRAAVGKNIHIIAGFNLPLLIEVVLSDPGTPVEEILMEAIGRAREQMVYVNQLMAGKTGDGEGKAGDGEGKTGDGEGYEDA